MSEEYIFSNKKIENFEIKMLRENQVCYIKIIPINKKSIPTNFLIKINGDNYNFDIFDKNGRELYKIYLKGKKIIPHFYLINGRFIYEIICDNDRIISLKKHNDKSNFNNIINNISENISCWAVNIYKTSRKEKKPFCDM
jgi:hypothetical protein